MSKWCLTDNFQQVIDAIDNIEQHVGLITATDDHTINGRLNNIDRCRNIDGGNASSVYLPIQMMDGGGA